MENPRQGSHAIAKLTGTCRNFVDKVIHAYNDYGLQEVLFTEEKEGRPNRLGGQWHAVSEALVKGVPRSAKEAVNIIHGISGHTFSLTWVRVLMRDAGVDCRHSAGYSRSRRGAATTSVHDYCNITSIS